MDKSYRNRVLGITLLVACTPSIFAYGIYGNTAGRADFATRYDLGSRLQYPGQSSATVYNFGKWAGFAANPPGVTNDMVTSSLAAATAAWSQYINVSYDNSALNAAGTGMLRLRYDPGLTGAYANGIQGGVAGEVGYAEMVFGQRPQAGGAWNATNFAWTVKHEMGHTLGLVDLYENQTEDFVDHPLNEAASPNLTLSSTQDNIMHRYNNTNDYSLDPTTNLDNDEIYGTALLWGSPHSFITTGDLADAYSAGDFPRRGSKNHHGQNNAKKWTYRGNFGSNTLTAGNPYVDIEFWGYVGFTGNLYGTPGSAFVYDGEISPNIHRFKVNNQNFKGNFKLTLESTFDREAYNYAQVVSGNNGTSFSLTPSVSGLTHEQAFGGLHRWARVMGAVPEINPGFALGLGLGFVVLLRRKRR